MADIMQERDFAANLKAREDLYETLGPISCFVGVGGNITTIGLEEDKMKAGVMVPMRLPVCAVMTDSCNIIMHMVCRFCIF
ncbi:MAG: hypothetical protein ACLR78_04400 [Roseburia sp.]